MPHHTESVTATSESMWAYTFAMQLCSFMLLVCKTLAFKDHYLFSTVSLFLRESASVSSLSV